MKLNVLILLHLTGVIPLTQCVPRKYYLIQDPKTWSDAQMYCRAHHTDLAIIESNDNMVGLQDVIQEQQFSSSAWIGLYREHPAFFWSLGNEPLGSMTPWYIGEPNNAGGIQWCGGITPEGWVDRPCTLNYPFVCFDDTKAGDQRYILISNAASWHHAQVYCRNHYTDLASSKDEIVNSVLMGLTSDWFWFGLTRESWKWINQTTYSTISWISEKPDIITGDETCGYINNGQAGDALCSEIMPFFCYREITGQQQIMRMEVRSDKDVNNPAVMDAVLETIQQKLKERGLERNISVKWRVQPDGKVFHKKKEKKTAENNECQVFFMNLRWMDPIAL